MSTPQMMALDQALAEVEVPPPDPGQWAEQLAGVARQLRAVIGRHRDIVPASAGFLPGGGRALRCHERVLAILRAGGLPDNWSVAGLYLLWIIVNGFSLAETQAGRSHPARTWRPRWASISPRCPAAASRTWSHWGASAPRPTSTSASNS